jgi:hypothetical protein
MEVHRQTDRNATHPQPVYGSNFGREGVKWRCHHENKEFIDGEKEGKLGGMNWEKMLGKLHSLFFDGCSSFNNHFENKQGHSVAEHFSVEVITRGGHFWQNSDIPIAIGLSNSYRNIGLVKDA